jgi:NADP-dependent 3-hydroxy acid dehydrogenase YdfG
MKNVIIITGASSGFGGDKDRGTPKQMLAS